MVAALVAGPRGLALVAVAGVFAGALVADARLAAIDGGRLAGLAGRPLDERAVLLEPLRMRQDGGAAARVRLLGGPARGEAGVVRVPAALVPVRAPEVGDFLRIRGRVMPLARFEEYQHRRGAHAAIAVSGLRLTGWRRGGLAGGLDSVRRRAEAGLRLGLPPREAALSLGMVLGQDERLGDRCARNSSAPVSRTFSPCRART